MYVLHQAYALVSYRTKAAVFERAEKRYQSDRDIPDISPSRCAQASLSAAISALIASSSKPICSSSRLHETSTPADTQSPPLPLGLPKLRLRGRAGTSYCKGTEQQQLLPCAFTVLRLSAALACRTRAA